MPNMDIRMYKRTTDENSEHVSKPREKMYMGWSWEKSVNLCEYLFKNFVILSHTLPAMVTNLFTHIFLGFINM